jgi:hypothetical protein
MSKPKTREELRNEILTTPYVDLEPHVQRGSVIVLDKGMDLLQVALSVAQDDKAMISALILKKLLVKATLQDYEKWKREKQFFNVIILQPYVLVQSAVAISPKAN